MLTFERIQTIVRRTFDPETIGVTVGRINEAGKRFRVIIHDEIAKVSHTFHVNVEHTEDELEEFIRDAAAALGLVKGPARVGDGE